MHRVLAGCVSMVGLLALSSVACAQAQGEVRVFADGAVTEVARQAGEALASSSGHSLVVISVTTESLQRRLESELADVVFGAAPAIDALENANRFVPGTRVDVARAADLSASYSAAMMATGENSEGARAFLRTLVGEEGRAAVTAAGLEPIGVP